jgi:hypothetical protein
MLSLLIIALLLTAGCNFNLPSSAPLPTPNAQTRPPITTQTAPDIGITAQAATPTAGSVCDVSAEKLRYVADVALELPKHTLTASLSTEYKNVTGQPLTQLAFYVPLGDTKNTFFLTSLSSEPVSADYKLDGTRLDVTLKNPLLPGCGVRVKLGFRLNIPAIPEGAAGGFGYFGYSERQTNLGDWLPTLAPRIKNDWLIPHSWYIGETRVTDIADYQINLQINGATNPAKLEVAAPGAVQRLDPTHWQIALLEARNFALSVSDVFIKQSTVSKDGVTIDLYRFPMEAGNDSSAHALATAKEANEIYTRLFGPSPFKRIAVVQADFPDGMEFSGIFFVSTNWFTRFWEGKPDGWLTLITAHEMAHQWWYSSVGDEQGVHPYMDEAFAIYSEVIYLEERYPELVSWWWKWRVEQYKPTGAVDSSVYDFTQVRPYINAVYLRGALMLQEIRATLGEQAFFVWLRHYADTGRDQIIEPIQLWGLLTADDYAKIASIRTKYLSKPDPLKGN